MREILARAMVWVGNEFFWHGQAGRVHVHVPLYMCMCEFKSNCRFIRLLGAGFHVPRVGNWHGNWLAGAAVSWKPAGYLRGRGFQHKAPYCTEYCLLTVSRLTTENKQTREPRFRAHCIWRSTSCSCTVEWSQLHATLGAFFLVGQMLVYIL